LRIAGQRPFLVSHTAVAKDEVEKALARFPAVVKDELDEDVAADAPAVGAPADGPARHRPTPPWHRSTVASSSTDHHIAADEYDIVDDAMVPAEVPPVPLIEIPEEMKEILARADQYWSQGPEGPGSIPRPSTACTKQARQTIDAGQTAVDPPTAADSPHMLTQTYPARHVGTPVSRPPPWRRPPAIQTSQVDCQGPSFVSTFRITSTRKRALARSNSEKPSSCHVESVGKYVLECITSSLTHKHVSHKS
jgi:hypothetical protein